MKNIIKLITGVIIILGILVGLFILTVKMSSLKVATTGFIITFTVIALGVLGVWLIIDSFYKYMM